MEKDSPFKLEHLRLGASSQPLQDIYTGSHRSLGSLFCTRRASYRAITRPVPGLMRLENAISGFRGVFCRFRFQHPDSVGKEIPLNLMKLGLSTAEHYGLYLTSRSVIWTNSFLSYDRNRAAYKPSSKYSHSLKILKIWIAGFVCLWWSIQLCTRTTKSRRPQNSLKPHVLYQQLVTPFSPFSPNPNPIWPSIRFNKSSYLSVTVN